MRICRVLGLRPDELLGYENPANPFGDGLEERRRRLAAFAAVMNEASLDLALAVMQALAATPELRNPPAEPGEIQAPVSRGKPAQSGPRT